MKNNVFRWIVLFFILIFISGIYVEEHFNVDWVLTFSSLGLIFFAILASRKEAHKEVNEREALEAQQKNLKFSINCIEKRLYRLQLLPFFIQLLIPATIGMWVTIVQANTQYLLISVAMVSALSVFGGSNFIRAMRRFM